MVSRVLVSVVVPTYNRLGYLKSCLRSLFSQSLDGRFYEVIVVDDGSSDGTGEFVRSFQKKFSLGSSRFPVLRYFGQCNGGPAAARNLGARHASGEFLAFLDDDCVAHRSWLEEIVKAFDRFPEAAYIGGYTIPIYKKGLFKNVTEFKRAYGKKKHHIIEIIPKGPGGIEHLVYTDNSVIRKSVFLEVKGFNTKFRLAAGEDSDFCLKLLDKNYAVYRVYSIQVDHNQRDTVLTLFRRNYIFGRLVVINYRDHFKGYTKISLGFLLEIYFKSGFTISITRHFFKDILIIFLLSFFWPVLALVLFLVKMLHRCIFETKTIKTTLSFCLLDMVVGSAFFIGNIAESFKSKIIHI